METPKKVHCFFEQSGTFKNEFIKLGIPAEDYDIQNNFGQTDHTDDLFAAITDAYDGKPSLFDSITPDDLILAFFPCIYFCENNRLYFRGEHNAIVKHNAKKKAEDILKRDELRHFFYGIALKLFAVCDIRGLRLVVENPYSPLHYLYDNFPYRPAIIDTDRQRRGDYFKKPTQFWFVNCKPTHGTSYQMPKEKKTVQNAAGAAMAGLCSEERSMISPDYARNFICDFILGKPQTYTQLSLFD